MRGKGEKSKDILLLRAQEKARKEEDEVTLKHLGQSLTSLVQVGSSPKEEEGAVDP